MDWENYPEQEAELLAQGRLDRLTYAPGQGPIKIKVVDPLRLPSGNFRLYLSDYRYGWQRDSSAAGIRLSPQAPSQVSALSDSLLTWTLLNEERPYEFWTASHSLRLKQEQYLPDLGISISLEQVAEAGRTANRGFLGAFLDYPQGQAQNWYRGLEDEPAGRFNFLATGPAQSDQNLDPNNSYGQNSQGGWYPVLLSDCRLSGRQATLSLNLQHEDACDIQRNNHPERILNRQRNVNVVLTPDKSRWSRCIVLESASPFYPPLLDSNLTLPPSGVSQLDWKRNQPSRDKEGRIEANSTGYSWFPGYAYDVETGERLNILFAENSVYDGKLFSGERFPGADMGNDMLFNPSDLTQIRDGLGRNFGEQSAFLASVLGGQHIIYVANSAYDECQSLVREYNRPPLPALPVAQRILSNNHLIWASMAYLAPGFAMKSGNIPPGELRIKLRVERPFNIYRATGNNQGYPLYEFSLDALQARKNQEDVAKSALDLLNIVPNPYYAYSSYELMQSEPLVKITNVPPRCDIRIYSLDGRFIREFKVNENYPDQVLNGQARLGEFGHALAEAQIRTSVDWDLRNFAGVQVGAGVYLVHVLVPGVGERVLKSFVVPRETEMRR